MIMQTSPESKFTPAEMVFARRMLFHVERGLSPELAAHAVLADDARIFTAFCDQSHFHAIHWAGETRSHTTRQGPGDLMVAELARRTFDRLAKADGLPSTCRTE